VTNYKMGPAGWICVLLVVLFLVAPLAVIGILSFSGASSLTFPPPSYSTKWFSTLLGDSEWRSSIGTSVRLAGTSTVLGLVVGVPLALGLSRGRIGRFRAIHGLVAAPLIIPTVSLAIGFYFVSAKAHLLDTLVPLVMAHVTLGLPLIVITVLAAERSLDPQLEPAARTLGASFVRTLARITLPLIAPGIIAGAVFAFLASWDDITNAVFLGTARIRPFPLKLWNAMQFELSPIIASAAALMSAVSLALVGAVTLIYVVRRKRMSERLAENVVLRTGG
jgi:ABC-type spermidine/putrescine transport system permease subunit II